MTVATSLVVANDASPQIAEEAVRQAMQRAGLSHANAVLLFLTTDFARHAREAVLAASRVAGCLQIAGGTAAGLATERSWVFDRPAAAALVLGGDYALLPPTGDNDETLFSFAGTSNLPGCWHSGPSRFGGLYTDAMFKDSLPTWQHGRITADAHTSLRMEGIDLRLGVSSGTRLLGDCHTVDQVNGYDLQRVGGQRAVDCLLRVLPAEFRRQEQLPLHLLSIAVVDGDDSPAPPRLIPLLTANGDGSLTIGDPLPTNARIVWGIRQPVSAEADMRQVLDHLVTSGPPPSFGLFVSCIGRGPYFYGAEERDWQAIKGRLPGMPFLGVYGSGQIAPVGGGNRLMQNAVVAALCSTRKDH